jgi:hypothetical protein
MSAERFHAQRLNVQCDRHPLDGDRNILGHVCRGLDGTGRGLWRTAGLGRGIVGSWQLQEARRLRIEQVQPYIAAYADPSPAGSWVFDLVIKNFGRTPATNVRVQILPDLKRAAYDDETVTLPAMIPTLVPGQEWRTFWDTQLARKDSSLPSSYVVEARFSDTAGKSEYCLRFELDWDASTHRDVVDVASFHDAAKALQEIPRR